MNSKTNLYASKYASHHYNRSVNTLCSLWYPETAEMSEDDFEFEVKKWLEICQHCKPSKILDCRSNFTFPVNPELQTWMAHSFNSTLFSLDVIQYSQVVPRDFISNLSLDQMLQQLIDMGLPEQLKINCFSNKFEAEQWLEIPSL